jgi:putative nucleotidyltransferase with HDIG domain
MNLSVTDPSSINLSSCLAKINAAECLPCPDQVLSRCLKLFTKEGTSINQIEESFKIEASLCSQLLKVANSAFYGTQNQIHEIRHAIMIIGLREVKNICLATALMQQFPQTSLPAAFDIIKFWRHSMLTSFIASELAADKAWIKRDAAQLYGLLHDIGRLVMAALMPDQFNKVIQLSQAENNSFYEAEDALGITHAYMGWALAKKWGLPEPVRLIVRWHHDPAKGTPWSKEASLVHVADYMANLIGEPSGVLRITPPSGRIMSLADISPYELQDYIKTLKNLVNKANAFVQADA